MEDRMTDRVTAMIVDKRSCARMAKLEGLREAITSRRTED